MQVKHCGWMWDVASGDEGWILTLAGGPKEHEGRTLVLKGAELWEASRDGKATRLVMLTAKDPRLLGDITAELGPWVPPAPRGRAR